MRKAWMNSIITRFMVGFAIVILATLAAFLFVYQQAHELASRLTYEKLYSQAEYYMQSFDTQHQQRIRASVRNWMTGFMTAASSSY